VTVSARRLTAADAEAYRALRLEGLRDSPESFGATYAEEEGNPASSFAGRLEKDFHFGLFDGDKLVGTAGFFREGMTKVAHRGKMIGVYLTPAARGKGNASLLIGAVIEEARKHVLQLHLAVIQQNEKARRLYERHGFRIYGEDPRGLRADGVFYDDYLMVLRLD
jgi:RimJ/RimL family protein N-acetyltransferase